MTGSRSAQAAFRTGPETIAVVPIAEVADIPFESDLPFRAIPRYAAQRNAPGLYWSCTDRQHLAYESHLEQMWMTWLDFDPTVAAMRAQPVQIRGVTADGTRWQHTIDLFYRHRDNTVTLAEVKHPVLLKGPGVEMKIDLVRDALADARVTFEVLTELAPTRWANVALLRAYGRPLPIPDATRHWIAQRVARPDTIRRVFDDPDAPPYHQAALFSALWHGTVRTDIDEPLGERSVVVAARGDL